jgi:hypothetical protein
MKHYPCQLALGAAVPCREEERCPKRTSATQELRSFLAHALRSKKDKLISIFLETKGQFFFGIAALLFAIALMLRGCRCHQVYALRLYNLPILRNETLSLPISPGCSGTLQGGGTMPEAYKRNTGTPFFSCTCIALQKR